MHSNLENYGRNKYTTKNHFHVIFIAAKEPSKKEHLKAKNTHHGTFIGTYLLGVCGKLCLRLADNFVAVVTNTNMNRHY